IYYEYFAKNAGLREGSFDFLILLNSDIIIPINTLNDIIQEIKNHKPKTYYRPKFITHIKKNLSQIRKQDLINPLMPFSFISGHSGGDFLVAKKNELIEYGRGYDEQNEGHRSSYKQHHMDTEIMYNMHFSGCSLKFLNNEYLHIAHSHENSAYDNTSNYSGYKNKECWGFIQYPRKKIEDNLTIIYNEEGN
nr:hypothetical protein [Candidatus Paceibacterota bacterium]